MLAYRPFFNLCLGISDNAQQNLNNRIGQQHHHNAHHGPEHALFGDFNFFFVAAAKNHLVTGNNNGDHGRKGNQAGYKADDKIGEFKKGVDRIAFRRFDSQGFAGFAPEKRSPQRRFI